MLAFSVREALRQAAGAFGPAGHSVELGSPATPEAIYLGGRGGPGRRGRQCRSSRPLVGGGRVDWLTALAQLRAEGAPGVLVTVAEVRGHAPRDPGAKMVVGPSRPGAASAAATWRRPRYAGPGR